MGLAEALVHIPQSERGGEIAQRGFDYQSCWALSEMLEYELNGKSYVFIFEYHDDILILDNTISPKDLTFAQVKTNESHWTASSLSKSTSKKPISIIGKLFIHYKDFIEYSPKLLFVTNASLKLCDCNGGKSFFGAHEVKKEHQEKFKKAIKDQAKLDDSCIDLSVMRFIQSSLSLEDHITHLKGKLCNFISKKYGESSTLNVNVLASLLDQECRSKSKIKSADIINFSELIAKKGFSSQELNNVLDSLNTSNKDLPTWEMAASVFHDLGKTSLQLITLQATFLQVCIEINQGVNNPSRIYQKVAVELYDEQKIHLNLNDYVIATMDKIDACCPDYKLTLTTGKKECIIIYSIIQMLLKGDDK